MGKCVSREQRKKCSARAQRGPSRDPGGDLGLLGSAEPQVDCSASLLGQRKEEDTLAFFLSLVRKHSSTWRFICTGLKWLEQSSNYLPDFLFCIHGLPALPLPPTNVPQTHLTHVLPLGKASMAPSGALHTHLLTCPQLHPLLQGRPRKCDRGPRLSEPLPAAAEQSMRQAWDACQRPWLPATDIV